MAYNNEPAPILMVRTISDYDMDQRLEPAANALKLALGERAATFVSASGDRQLSTALALQIRLSQLGKDISYNHNLALTDVMDETQFDRRGTEPIKTVLTQAALRGIWTTQEQTGLVMVTSEYPILGAIRAQGRALGIPPYHSQTEIEPGQIIEVNPELIGFDQPTEDEIRAFQNPERAEQAPPVKTWLDFFRRKPHN